jgi:DNA/RNA-binding domain of Phe-tRNA-synthetase-like protein
MFEGEVVIVDPEKNMVRMLNHVGSRVWELADGTHTTKDILTILTKEFEVEEKEAEDSIEGFIEELADKGLLTWN